MKIRANKQKRKEKKRKKKEGSRSRQSRLLTFSLLSLSDACVTFSRHFVVLPTLFQIHHTHSHTTHIYPPHVTFALPSNQHAYTSSFNSFVTDYSTFPFYFRSLIVKKNTQIEITMSLLALDRLSEEKAD